MSVCVHAYPVVNVSDMFFVRASFSPSSKLHSGVCAVVRLRVGLVTGCVLEEGARSVTVPPTQRPLCFEHGGEWAERVARGSSGET